MPGKPLKGAIQEAILAETDSPLTDLLPYLYGLSPAKYGEWVFQWLVHLLQHFLS